MDFIAITKSEVPGLHLQQRLTISRIIDSNNVSEALIVVGVLIASRWI
jgi:hypothetical protein